MSTEKKKASKKSLVFLSLMILGSVGLDQVTKVHAERELMVWQDEENLKFYKGKRYPLLATADVPPAPNDDEFYLALNLNYVRNQGAAWGALNDADDSFRIPFFYIVTVIAIFIIFMYIRSTPPHHRVARFALCLILSGAFGNFIDRVRLGYVIDWIDVNWKIMGWRYYFPNFNHADSAITVGLGFLLVDMLILERMRAKESEPAGSQKAEPA